jgi:hypothetical protein
MATFTHTIVTYGGGEVLELVLNAIVALFKDQEFFIALKISGILFGFWVIVNSIVQNSAIVPFKWFAWFLISTNLILYPKRPFNQIRARCRRSTLSTRIFCIDYKSSWRCSG